jgi:hemoglobin/transferrin/lactoferrin receptor protein
MANAGIQYQSQRFGIIANITHANYGDLRMGSKSYIDSWPDFGLRNYYVKQLDQPVLLANGKYQVDTLIKNNDPLKQVGTAYNQTDVFLKMGLKTGKINESLIHVLNFQGSLNSNIPRYDRLQQQSVSFFEPYGIPTVPPYGIIQARWDYAPQHRTFLAYTLTKENDKHRNRLIIAHQYFEVGRVTRSYNHVVNNLKERTQLDKVNMFTINYDRLDQWKSWQINSGMEYVYNYVNSQGTIKNVVTGEITPGPARYVDSFGNTHSASVFSQASKTVGRYGTKIELGARITYYSLRGVFTENNYWNMPYPEITFNQTAPSYNLGVVQPLGKNFLMKASFNQAYRNPNIDDMSKVFESLRGQKVLVPTEKLTPEVSRTSDLHFSFKFSQRFFVEFGGFYTVVDNLMSDVFGTFKGSDSLDWDGIRTPVYQIKNVGTGSIYGGFANVQWNIAQKLWLNASINETKGFVEYSNSNWNKGNNRLDHIPPIFGQVALRWRESKWFAEAQCVFNGTKPVSEYSVSGEDNLQYATASGNPAWQVYNVRGGISNFHGLNLMVSVENILDLRYRYFASGVTAAGRGIHITAGYKF